MIQIRLNVGGRERSMIRIHSNTRRRDQVGDSDTLESGRERSSGRFEFARMR